MPADPPPLHARPLHEADLPADPLAAFLAWFADASAHGEAMPEAMALATATREGCPSVRMVLLKGADERGFTFYTGYASRKGLELAANPRAALLFYWGKVGRQVRVEGVVARVPREVSGTYFRTRPLGSRLSALASRQSEVVAERAVLEARVEGLHRELGDGEPPLPDDWGGYRLEPGEYEFWQHRDDRLHDRIRYRVDGGRWVVERLSP